MKKLEFKEHGVKVQSTVGRAILLTSKVGSSFMKATFRECPLVWDTGIARTNMVVEMGTMLHKFQVDGEPIWLPCLSYHLPSAEIRLFSPQTYQTLYGGHSVFQGDRIEIFVGEHRISISID